MYIDNNKKKRRISPSVLAAYTAVAILIGGFFLSYNYIQSKKIVAYDYIANIFYTNNLNVIVEEDGIKREEAVTEEGPVTNDYIGYLNIPKINLIKGFLDKRSNENDVEKNILVVEGSSYPDIDKGNLILAGHSGTGWKAFFNDLYKLNKGDVAYVTYKNKK